MSLSSSVLRSTFSSSSMPSEISNGAPDALVGQLRIADVRAAAVAAHAPLRSGYAAGLVSDTIW